jgi:hypothetical protein
MASMLRIRAVINYSPGGPGLWTSYFRGVAVPPTTPEATDATARVRAFWGAMAAFMTTDTSVDVSQQVDVLDDATGLLLSQLTAAPLTQVVGTGTGVKGPTMTAFVLKDLTATVVNGRQLKGRHFISPIREASQSFSAPTSADRTNIIAAATAMLTGTTAGDPVVWHRPNPATGQLGLSGFVTAYDVSFKWGVLRSRRD